MPNFDQKIFWFPESYNELRKEMFTHWNPKVTGKHPHHMLAEVRWSDVRCSWAMAYDAEMFVEYMNEKLKGVYKIALRTNDDELKIGYICSVFLKELRRIRGEPNP
jgi:hypothetical protein